MNSKPVLRIHPAVFVVGVFFWTAVIIAVSALAQDSVVVNPPGNAPGNVILPWGDLVGTLLGWCAAAAGTIAAIAVSWLAKVLGERWTAITKIAQVDQLLKRAIEYAANTTAGVVKGQTIKVPVANEFLCRAIQYAVDSAPKWMIAFMGGDAGIRAKLIARAEFEKDATDNALNAPPATAEAKSAVTEGKDKPIE